MWYSSFPFDKKANVGNFGGFKMAGYTHFSKVGKKIHRNQLEKEI